MRMYRRHAPKREVQVVNVKGSCLAGALLLLAACAASTPVKPDASGDAVPGKTVPSTLPEPGNPDFDADEIPESLLRAVEDTYRRPVPLDCVTIAAEIQTLDSVLGPDVDTLKAADIPDHIVANAAVGAVKGMIPYGGLFQLFSRATQRERKIAEALEAGDIRRGYLKGLGEEAGCSPPAAPARGK